MKLATINDGTRDGQLVVVSRNLKSLVPATNIAPNLQAAIDDWASVEPRLRVLAQQLETAGSSPSGTIVFDQSKALSPLPRAWQWLDGSVYSSHGDLMCAVLGLEKLSYDERPLMYQGLSDRFYAPTEDSPFPTEDDQIDFEGEFGVITDTVPAGVSVADASRHIQLIVLINDWSLRRLAPIEMKTGFGSIQAKPPCSMAPVAVTPDELRGAWDAARVHLNLDVWLNGKRFGAANGGPMAFGFDRLIAHAAYSRNLVAGTVIGSGTVSNANCREVGSSCIAERRGIELLDTGRAVTPFMSFGDRVRMEVSMRDGNSVFGAIDQKVVRAA